MMAIATGTNRMNRPIRLGVIVGNRDFFPDLLIAEARKDILKLLTELEVGVVIVDEQSTKLGGIETFADARKCADLFAMHRDTLDGVLVVLPNFGDEKAVTDTLKLSGLSVPVLVQAYPDDLNRLGVTRRRDAFCGKISVCNNLKQAGIAYTLTDKHVVHPTHESFRRDLKQFLAVCRVVRVLRGARLGAVGARPGAFNTVRYSEKILDRAGIGITTLDLSEVLGKASRIAADDPRLIVKLQSIRGYAPTPGVPDERLVKMATLGVVLDEFIDQYGLDGTAIQCWTSLQQNYGVNVCTSMSMMSNSLLPSACEVDITGALSMLALQAASLEPSALVDWNNNYGTGPDGDEDKCVFFHCGNWPKKFAPDSSVANAPILGSTLGVENTFGAMQGRGAAGPMSYARFTTDDTAGVIRGYVGQGSLTDDPLDTFGHRAVAHVPRLQDLLRYICAHGFEHHVAANRSHVAGAVAEACGKYLGWSMYTHA
jgi:L-fucose isomerase-like protein